MLEVHLKAPRYVLLNRNATLKCEYNVSFDHIHKVEWLKGDGKIFQYVKGRNPPFYNYTIAGGKISVSRTESDVRKKERKTKKRFNLGQRRRKIRKLLGLRKVGFFLSSFSLSSSLKLESFTF